MGRAAQVRLLAGRRRAARRRGRQAQGAQRPWTQGFFGVRVLRFDAITCSLISWITLHCMAECWQEVAAEGTLRLCSLCMLGRSHVTGAAGQAGRARGGTAHAAGHHRGGAARGAGGGQRQEGADPIQPVDLLCILRTCMSGVRQWVIAGGVLRCICLFRMSRAPVW